MKVCAVVAAYYGNGGAGALATIAPALDDPERTALRRGASVLREAVALLRRVG
jgi:hypothetical protein